MMELFHTMLETLSSLLPEPLRGHGVLLLVGMGLLLLAAMVLGSVLQKPKYPFRPRAVLTESELRLYQVLNRCMPPGTLLLAKVRLADFMEVTLRGKHYMRHFGRISQKHSDFLVIDEKTSRPLLSIELDDDSHRYSRRTRESDAFKNQAFAAARLPILRLPVKKGYAAGWLKDRVEEKIFRS